MNGILERVSNIGIIPVIAIEDAAKAVPLAKALVAGGLPAAEVTFRTAAAEEAMRAIVKEVPEMLVGAGTVLTPEQADRALDAGAKFIVTPGFNPEMVKYVLAKGELIMPGTATPGEMEQAMSLGLSAVKFFPAEQNGGIATLKAVAGPYKNLKWMPTGGVTTKNLMDYLSFNQILACGGTWMVKKELIDAENWEEITRISREAVKTMLGFSLGHIGINCTDEEAAHKTAKTLCTLFGFDYKPGNNSNFAGATVECMKQSFPGTHGHIAIATNSVARAMFHLSFQSIDFDESTLKTDASGNPKVIYLKDEIGGFAVHLLQK
ncbi:MAG: bifunctional 4-hydroxy-2-oxoglutarate aldolase/2-dehydro-3-deoxy-phosphogluconate aldolase [Candidatus Fimivivens sp.]